MVNDSTVSFNSTDSVVIEHERDEHWHEHERQKRLWIKVFPFEISCFRTFVTNHLIVRFWNALFTLMTVSLIVYVVILVNEHKYVSDDVPLFMTILLNFEGFIFLFLPYICFLFSKIMISNSDLADLITFAIKTDHRVKFKFALLTHINFFCLLVAVVSYCVKETYAHMIVVLITSLLYFGPLNISVSLSVCVVELHRIRIQQLRNDIIESTLSLESAKEKMIDSCEGRETTTTTSADPSINSGESSVTGYPPQDVMDSLKEQYYQLYAICARTSVNYGHYLLFFFAFGILYAFTVIFGIYVGQYPTNGIIGFVVVGLFMVLELGLAITSCNEAGHLVCRDLSNYLMSLPCMQGESSFLPVSEVEVKSKRANALLLLSAMDFVKLQICYFGNMAMRSQLLLALIGSILLAVIPVLIASES
mmetsp:Transcript_27621/g.51590  ORF Transcript_27621/g.51590 Transcript_27621/m.51590 type:complete len:420 (+) Transcript_27621:264-1523(+)